MSSFPFIVSTSVVQSNFKFEWCYFDCFHCDFKFIWRDFDRDSLIFKLRIVFYFQLFCPQMYAIVNWRAQFFFPVNFPLREYFFACPPSPISFLINKRKHNKRKCTAQVKKYFVDYQDWKYADERHRRKETVKENAQFRFCGQTRAIRYEIVFRGIQPCFLHGGSERLNPATEAARFLKKLEIHSVCSMVKESTFLKGNFCIYKVFMDVFFNFTSAWKKTAKCACEMCICHVLAWTDPRSSLCYATCFLGLTYYYYLNQSRYKKIAN